MPTNTHAAEVRFEAQVRDDDWLYPAEPIGCPVCDCSWEPSDDYPSICPACTDRGY